MRIQDANGGWIASAPDLVQVGEDVRRGVERAEQHLAEGHLGEARRPASSRRLVLRSRLADPPDHGGTGRNTWHTGSMPGTYTMLVRTSGGMSWAALFNRRDDASGKSYGDIDAALWTAANGVKSWPTHDLFPKYFS